MGTCYFCAAAIPDGAEICVICGMAAAPETATVAAGVSAAGASPSPPSPLPPPAPPALAPTPVAPVGPRLTTPPASLARGALPRPSRRALLILGVVLALLLGGGVAYAVLKPPGPSGEVSVERYFEALGEGDTTAALALVVDSSRYAPEDYPLLDRKVLADEDNRPSDVRILESRRVDDYGGVTFDQVRVSYRIGDQPVEQWIVAGQPVGDEDYLLEQPFMRLSVDSPGGRQLAVNGVAFDDDTLDTYVFPGLYTVTAEQNALLTGESKPARLSVDRSGEPALAVEFAPPALAPGAREAVEAQVRQRLDTCAQDTTGDPDGCPFSIFVFADDVSVRWTITSYPTIDIEVGRSIFGGGQATIDGSGGVVHYEATYTNFAGERQTESGDESFFVNGTVSVEGSSLTVSIR